MDKRRILVIGGGAAGFFGAIAAAEANPTATVTLLERSKNVLAKVRISGGGRCNVTHHCFDPSELVKNYPRGSRELRGPFSRFQPRDMLAWLKRRGVATKAEADGRIFPTTNDSQTIIDALTEAAKEAGVKVWTGVNIESVQAGEDNPRFAVSLKNGTVLDAECLLLATGSSPAGHRWAEQLGHSLQPLVPSLFTFNIPKGGLSALAGVAAADVEVSLTGTSQRQRGPLLITHWGFSGPVALKLSAWAARELEEKSYSAELTVNWIPALRLEAVRDELEKEKRDHAKKLITSASPFSLPQKLWRALVERAGIASDRRWAHLPRQEQSALTDVLTKDRYRVEGKTTNKEEFVTCGGVTLAEINFRTMESKVTPGLYFAGEILDIDGVTGGFNFQAAWTTSWIAGQAMSA